MSSSSSQFKKIEEEKNRVSFYFQDARHIPIVVGGSFLSLKSISFFFKIRILNQPSGAIIKYHPTDIFIYIFNIFIYAYLQ